MIKFSEWVIKESAERSLAIGDVLLKIKKANTNILFNG